MTRIKTLNKKDCDGETVSIIKGRVLTSCGYKDVEDLQVGDFLVDEEGRMCKLKDIKRSFLLNKGAIQLGDTIVSSDMMFLLDEGAYGSFNVEACYKAVFKDVRTTSTLGHFDRLGLPIYDLNAIKAYTKGKQLRGKKVNLPMSTPIHTLIVDGARWCIVDEMLLACAEEIRGFRVKED